MTDTISRLQEALADRYRIERPVGAGGMATVYLASDLRHHRKVAIKVLRPEAAALLGAERFVREVTTTAQLQHPNILSLFDSGSAGEFLYYVMPFIDGETLRQKLERESQLGIDEAVRIAIEVANALDYAHRQGVIHRDIKPENILLHDGRAMVADFGVALAISAAAAGGGNRMTETGLAVGTPNYMSPEQALADRDITFRSDIYSLGAVLFEMLTGAAPHHAPSVQQVIMKIATEDAPRASTLRKSVPPHVANAVSVALEKVPADRFSRASAFAEALVNPHFGATASQAKPFEVRARRFPVALLFAGIALGVIVGAAVAKALVRQPSRPVTRFVVALPDSASFNPGAGVNLTISPDGLRLVYTGRTSTGKEMIYLRELGQLGIQSIAGTEAGKIPSFSPSGASMAFTAGGALKTVSMQGSTGGPALTVVAEGVPSAGGGLTWADDDRIYFVNDSGAIQSVSPDGGALKDVASRESDAGFMWIDALPGAEALIATIGRLGVPEASEVAVVPTNGGKVRRLFRATMARYSSGYLVYTTSDGALMAVAFDAKRAVVTGRPFALFRGVDVYLGSASQFALSKSGSLVWVGFGGVRELQKIDRSGALSSVDSSLKGDIRAFSLSPDGERIAVTTLEVSGLRVGILPIGRGSLTPITFEGTRNLGLSWSSDGRSITLLSNRSGANALWMVPADGSGGGRALPISGNVFSAEWSFSGDALVVSRPIPGAGSEVVGYRLGVDSVPRPLLSGAFLTLYALISPDGHWLAYSSNETGQDQVYVQPYPATHEGKWQVSPGGGIEPSWSHRGHGLFFLAPSGELVSVDMSVDASGKPKFSPPRALFHIPLDQSASGRRYQAMPDDQHFVFLHSAGGATRDLMVVENFVEEIKAKAPR